MALTGTPTPERENFFQFLLREKKEWGKCLRSILADAFVTKKDLIRQLDETKALIEELDYKRVLLESEIRHYTDKKDKKFILKHWQKLLYLYQKYHPKIFERIVVSCFEFHRSYSKWGGGGGMRTVRLSDLLEKWSNGCMYEGMPVISFRRLYFYHQGKSKIEIDCITPQGKRKTIYQGKIGDYEYFLQEWPECPSWSERSVSDFKFNSPHTIIKKGETL